MACLGPSVLDLFLVFTSKWHLINAGEVRTTGANDAALMLTGAERSNDRDSGKRRPRLEKWLRTSAIIGED